MARRIRPSPEQIAIAAYYLAQSRDFRPGADLDDWLRAEQSLVERDRKLLARPFGQANWIARSQGKPAVGAYESYLYTDARVWGLPAGDLGPYKVLMTFAPDFPDRRVRPAYVLRADTHLSFNDQLRPMTETDNSVFHGGGPSDEIAALLSLINGVRFRAGGAIRQFYPDDDPRGSPRFDEAPPQPTVANFAGLIPSAGQARQLNTDLLERYPLLEAEDAVALVRAARAYQNALWVAESDPNLAWLFLVSAVEAAAVHFQTSTVPAAELLKKLRPKEPDRNYLFNCQRGRTS